MIYKTLFPNYHITALELLYIKYGKSEGINMNQTEIVNNAIMSHELITKEWEHTDCAKKLYKWDERYNKEFFKGELGTPVISFERTCYRILGHFVIGRNAIGVRWNININERYINRPLWEKLMILLHEKGHQWQHEYGKPGKRNYHNKEFQHKMELLGIPCDSRGITIAVRDPFVSLLRRHGIDVDYIEHQKKGNILIENDIISKNNDFGSGSKLKKWTCGCTNVRVAIEDFQAKCLKCNKKFIRV